MSRNPYLAASRPASSFTRSSRSSKSNAATKSSSLLGRSRSSANLSGGFGPGFGSSSGAYSSASNYSVSPIGSSWQRSSSTARLNRLSSGELSQSPTSSLPLANTATITYGIRDANQRHLDRAASASSSFDGPQSSLKDSSSNPPSHDIHLQNYQKSKLQQSQAKTGSTELAQDPTRTNKSTGLDQSKVGTASIDSSGIDHPCNDVDGLRSTSPSHRRLGPQSSLHKSNSLDIGRKMADPAPSIYSSLSLDRLLYKADTMSERELRKMFKELMVEFEQLRVQLKSTEEEEKQVQQDWIRKERQMQRKISELEEENKQLEQYKQEIQRLKDENCSLIRVVSKLTKQTS